MANKLLGTFQSSRLQTASSVHLDDFFHFILCVAFLKLLIWSPEMLSGHWITVCLVLQSCWNNPYSLSSSLKFSNNHAGQFVQYTF